MSGQKEFDMRILLLTSLILLAACVAPQNNSGMKAAEPPPAMAPVEKPSEPAPNAAVEEKIAVAAPGEVDFGCNSDSDCKIKDVGSCCGYSPACVHKNSPTDPAGVRAQCARDGLSSVCGFNEITACRCVRNQCVGDQEPVGGWMDDPPAPPPANR